MKLIYDDKKPITGCLGTTGRDKILMGLQRSMKKLLEVMGMFTILMGWWFHRYIHMSKFTTVRILNAQFVSIDIKLQKLYFIVLLAQQLTAFFKPIYESHHKSHYLTDTPPF